MNAIRGWVEAGILEATWAERIGWTLLHSLWQIALIAGVYALLAAMLRKHSAKVRYLCGCVALVVMICVPVGTYVLMPGGSGPGTPELDVTPVVAELTELAPAAFPDPDAVPPRVEAFVDLPAVMPSPEVVSAPVVDSKAEPAAIVSSSMLRPWMPWATAAWLLGVSLLSLRPILGWLHIRRLQHHGWSPLSDSMRREAGRLARRLGVTRAVQFVQSTLVEVPTVVGSLRPFVLLPASAVSGLSVAQIEMILAHELAHIRRHDYLVNLAQTVLEALLFFHPAMWWVSRQVRKERENCCDDIAVAVSGSREHYVQALTRLEEQRAAVSVAALAATGGSLLERVRRLLGQPGAEFGYRSATAWVAGLVAVGLVSLALATGDAPQNEGEGAAGEDTESGEVTPVPTEHEAVLTVRELFEAVESGDYERAIGLAVEGELKREGLVEVSEAYDLDKADIAEALVGGTRAAVLTKPLPASVTARPGQFGFSLVPFGDQWRIRDVDFLPDDKAVKEWLAEFRRIEPGARPAEAVPQSDDPQSDREAMLAYARALEAGDFKKLKEIWEFQDDLDRQFAGKMAAMFAKAPDLSVELVTMQPMDDDSLFACFLMRDGPEGFGKQPTPQFATFQRKDDGWRCAPPQNLRTIVQARTMGAAQFGRRAIVQQMIAARFSPDYMTKRVAYTKAQRDAFARLARPPYKLDHFGGIAEQMTASLAKMEAMKSESWKDLWRLMLEEHGEEALPQPGDFYLRFHLEAEKDDAGARKISVADGSPDILVEPLPCLTEDHVLWAGVSKGPVGATSQVTIMLTKGGTKIFRALTGESIGKRVAIMIDDQVVTAPVIRSALGGKAMISGNFSRKEAEAIAEKLNSFRKDAVKLLDEFEKKPGAGDKGAGVPKSNPQEAVNRMVQELLGLRGKHPELARFGEALRHEVDAWNGVIRVSLAYEHNYHSGTKRKPAGPKDANNPWCRISLRIGPADGGPSQLKSGPVEAGRSIRWNGSSAARSYRLGDPPLVAFVAVETGSETLRRDVNRIIDRELSGLIGAGHGENPDNPLGLDNATLIRLFKTGKTLRAAARECVAYQVKYSKVPESAAALFEDSQQFRKGMIADPFAAEGGVLRITQRMDGPDDNWLQVWSVGPDGDWDGGKVIDSADPSLDGDLGAEMRIGKGAFNWLADKTIAMHLDGKRLSHYLAAQGPIYPGAINPHQTLDWGPVVDGLRLAVKLVPDKESYVLGENIELDFFVRNVSRYPITIAGFSVLQADGQDSVVIRNEQNEELKVGHDRYIGPTRIQRDTLKTGQVAGFRGSDLAFLAKGMPIPGCPVGYTVVTKPGQHMLQFTLNFPDGESFGPDGMPRPTDWQGTLRTGAEAIMIVDQPNGAANEAMDDAMREKVAAAEAAVAAAEAAAMGWSKLTGGLIGRLVVAKSKITTAEQFQINLELRNGNRGGGPWLPVQLGNPFLFDARVTDANGNLVPPTMGRGDVSYASKWSVIRPFPDEKLSIPVTIRSQDGAKAAQLDTTTKIWKLPPGKYKISGTYSSPKEIGYEGEHTPWAGRLLLPSVEVEVVAEEIGEAKTGVEAIDDVKVRLHSPRAQWDDGRWTLFFKTDLESEAERVLPHYGAPIDEFLLELDGEWFEEKNRGAGAYRSVFPSPAKQRRDLHTRICAREWRSMASGEALPEFAPGRHTVRIGFPLADKPDATGQRPRAVSNPVEIVTATEEVGATTIELRKCLGRITTRIGELKGQYRELAELDDVKLGNSVTANPDNPLHLGFEYSHKFDGWDPNKQPKIGKDGCHINVRFGSPDNPSAMMATVPLPGFGNLVARYLVVVGEGARAAKFREAVTAVIREELEKLRGGGPDVIWGKPSKGVRARLVEVLRIAGSSETPHPVLQLRYDAENIGSHILSLPENGRSHQVEVDGQWYEWVDPRIFRKEDGSFSSGVSKQLEFEPRRKHVRQTVDVAGNWRAIPEGKESAYGARRHGSGYAVVEDDYGKELVLTPGSHHVRVAVICPSARASFNGVVRAVSNPVGVQIGAPKVFASPNSKHDGVIRGRIIDPHPSARATEYHVMLWHPDWETNTGEAPALVIKAGEQFEFRDLRPGDYELRAREWRPKGRVVNWNTDWTPIVAGATVVEGKAAEVQLVFGPGDTGRWSEACTWGDAVDGVMMCITKRKFRIAPGEELDLRVEIYNLGKIDRRIALEHEAWELEVNGKWLKPSGGMSGLRRHLPLPAKQAQHQVEVWPWLWENMTAAIKELPPGKHTIRVARLLNGEGRSPRNPPQIRIVSQPVTVEVVAGDEVEGNGAASLPDGVYRVPLSNSGEKGVTVKRSDTDGTVMLLDRLTDQLGTTSMTSIANDNTRFRIDLKSAGPFAEGEEIGHMALVIDGLCTTIWSHSDPDKQRRMELSSRVIGKEASARIADRLGIEPRMRHHPGHKMEVRFSPKKPVFKPGEPVVLRMEIRNVGENRTFTFVDGGQQRGPRNNQFGFTAFRDGGKGAEVPDTGDATNHGGPGAHITLKPGQVFEKEVDLAKWFDLSKPDTYKIDGRFEMVINTDAGQYPFGWDDWAKGTTLVTIANEEPGGGGKVMPKQILPIMEAMRREVMRLGEEYPQLAGAKAVETTPGEWLFEHDCRYMGKRGYEHTGPFPVAIGLRVMTTERFAEQVVAMSYPGYRWEYLGLVGWPTLHVGEGVPPALTGKLQQVLRNVMVGIGPLNRAALAAGLPEGIQQERDRLLAEADAKIRDGVRKLAETYPLLKKGQSWDRLQMASAPGRIGIHIRRTQGGKGRTDAQEFPPAEAFSILVVVKLPPDEIEQLALSPHYPRLGLVGQVGTRAANPELEAALKKLVSEALAPLAELEQRASEPGSGPVPVAPATSDFRRGQSEAEADLKAGRACYFHLGMLSADSQLADILQRDYGLTLVDLGCTPVPPVGEHAKGYNEIIVRELGRKFGPDFIKKAWEKDRVLREEARKHKGSGKEAAPDTRESGDDAGPRFVEAGQPGVPTLEEVLEALRDRRSKYQSAALKIAFTRTVNDVAGQAARTEESVFLSNWNNFREDARDVRARGQKGRTVSRYLLGGVRAEAGPADGGSANQIRYLSHDTGHNIETTLWPHIHGPDAWFVEYLRDAEKAGNLKIQTVAIALEKRSTDAGPQVVMLEAGGKRLTLVPEWDWAITEYLGVMAGGHRKHGDFWFPKSVTFHQTLKDLEGGWKNYRDEIVLTSVDTAAKIPKETFRIPQPGVDDRVVVAYPKWNSDWMTEAVEPQRIRDSVRQEHRFVWSERLNARDARIWQTSLSWRDPDRRRRALDPRRGVDLGYDEGIPSLPFLSPDGGRIIWAVYDLESERMLPVAHIPGEARVEKNGFRFEAGFSPEKAEIMVGEAIYVTFHVKNTGGAPIYLETGGDGRSIRSYRFRFSATDEQGAPARDPYPSPGHSGGVQGPPPEIKPGETYSDKLQLAKWLVFERPGNYTVRCTRTLQFCEKQEFTQDHALVHRFATSFRLKVAPRTEEGLKTRITTLGNRLRAEVDERSARLTAQLLVETGDARIIPDLLWAAEKWSGGSWALRQLVIFNDDPRVMALYREALRHSRGKSRRSSAARLMGESGNRGFVRDLVAALGKENDEFVLTTVAMALGKLGDRQAVPVFKKHRDHGHPHVRLAVEQALVQCGESLDVKRFQAMIRSTAPTWNGAAQFVSANAGAAAPRILAECLDFEHPAAAVSQGNSDANPAYRNGMLFMYIEQAGGPQFKYKRVHQRPATEAETEANRQTLQKVIEWLASGPEVEAVRSDDPMQAGPVAPAMPFDQLKVVMRCNWYGNLRRELTIRGNGGAVYTIVTPEDKAEYRTEFQLSGGQRESLVRALEATRWLELVPEKIMADDAVEYELVLDRKDRTTEAEFMVQRRPPYHALEMFLNCFDRQEQLFYQLTASTRDHRVDAARSIQNELSSRMKHPGRAPAVHLKDIDYTRFVPVLIPWLKDRKNHSTNEMAAAIDLVGYLKLESERESVEALMGLHTYSNWNCVCECLVRLGDPRSIPVLKARAMKSGADAACWALMRMGTPAEDAICEVLRTPRKPNNNCAYKMVRVYLKHFHELPEPVSPRVVEAIRAARRAQPTHPFSDYADRLLGFIEGGNPVLDLLVTIVPEKSEYAGGEPVLVQWKIENTGNQARTILWHPLHYSPVVFSFMKPGGVAWIRVDLRRSMFNKRPSPPEPLVLQPGESRAARIDLSHFLPEGTGMRPGTYVIAGSYWPRAKEAAIPAEFLNDPKFGGAMLERIGSGVARIVVLRRPRTAEEEKREAERLQREAERLQREAEEAKKRAVDRAARDADQAPED